MLLFSISCEKENTSPDSPSWPPIYSIAPDLGDYTIMKAEELYDLDNARNWQYAVVKAHDFNFLDQDDNLGFILAFLNMENLELKYDKHQDVWMAGGWTEHPYLSPLANRDSIIYKCEVKNNAIEWEITFIVLNSYRALMIRGVSDIHNTSGTWVVHRWPRVRENETFNPDTLFHVNWFSSGIPDHPNLTLKAPAYEFEYTYKVDPTKNWDRELIVKDLSVATNSKTDDIFELYWNSMDKSGSARTEFIYGDDSLHCWNEELRNITCEN